VEVQRKFSIPFACLVFAAIGVPLGIQPSRSVHSRGFSMSLVLIFVYYLLLTFGQNLGDRGALPTAVAVWLPNVALSLAAAYLLARAAREDGSRRPALWDRLAAAVRQRTAWRGASLG
jgi:lipopolysaccharide export system permease protein